MGPLSRIQELVERDGKQVDGGLGAGRAGHGPAVQAEQFASLGLLRRVDDHRDRFEAGDAASHLGPLTPGVVQSSGPNRSSRQGHESRVRWCAVKRAGRRKPSARGVDVTAARGAGVACVMETSGRDAGLAAATARARRECAHASTTSLGGGRRSGERRRGTPAPALLELRVQPVEHVVHVVQFVEDRGPRGRRPAEVQRHRVGAGTPARRPWQTAPTAAPGRCRRRCRARSGPAGRRA